ncbi:MAG: hypothetical protein NWQ13_00590, partial [Glaciimonas sp.]|nr:hypothetical protein [Glaciimonas sp.]
MMPKHRLTHLGLIVAAISFSSVATIATIASISVVHAAEVVDQAAKPETVRPEIGTPLNAAQALIKDKKYSEALVQLRTTDAVAAKTPYEAFAIERMQAMLAAVTGDNALAIKSLETVIASGRLSPTEQSAYVQTLAQEYY